MTGKVHNLLFSLFKDEMKQVGSKLIEYFNIKRCKSTIINNHLDLKHKQYSLRNEVEGLV